MICSIFSNKEILSGYFHLKTKVDQAFKTAYPGQFVMIRLSLNSNDPFLRRPFSIMDVDSSGYLNIVYKILGRGTKMLSEMNEGAQIDVMGPLGTGFPIIQEKHHAILVGGGVGIPPLLFLARKLNRKNKISIFLGGRTKNELPLSDKFDDLPVICCTDDGSFGREGLVTKPLFEALDGNSADNPVIFACGPDPMLKAIAQECGKRRIRAYLSLEEHMGCGVGACFGCVVPTDKGLKTVCKDGPVFEAQTIRKWSNI